MVSEKGYSFEWANGAKAGPSEVSLIKSKLLLDGIDDDVQSTKKRGVEDSRAKENQGQVEEDVEWSDCDEAEISRNISILEKSLNSSTTTTATRVSPAGTTSKVSLVQSKRLSDDIGGDVQSKKRKVEGTNESRNQNPNFRDDAEDEDVEWSDCDEAEISRNISLLEQSLNSSCSKDTSTEGVNTRVR